MRYRFRDIGDPWMVSAGIAKVAWKRIRNTGPSLAHSASTAPAPGPAPAPAPAPAIAPEPAPIPAEHGTVGQGNREERLIQHMNNACARIEEKYVHSKDQVMLAWIAFEDAFAQCEDSQEGCSLLLQTPETRQLWRDMMLHADPQMQHLLEIFMEDNPEAHAAAKHVLDT